MITSEIASSVALVFVYSGRPAAVVHSLDAVARLAGIHPEMLRHYCRLGLFETRPVPGESDPAFDEDALYAVRRYEHYRRHEGLDRRALRMLFRLSREVERLRAEVQQLRR